MRYAFDTLKLVTEPGGAVALAAALFVQDLPPSDDLLVIISGGNVDEAMFTKALTIS
jgi:threonine dehydratase